jgi:ATP-dependent Lon protease
MAAYNAGVKRVFIPYDNAKDLEEIDPLAKDNLEFIPCKNISEILSAALVPHSEADKTELCDEKLPEISGKVGIGVSASSK